MSTYTLINKDDKFDGLPQALLLLPITGGLLCIPENWVNVGLAAFVPFAIVLSAVMIPGWILFVTLSHRLRTLPLGRRRMNLAWGALIAGSTLVFSLMLLLTDGLMFHGEVLPEEHHLFIILRAIVYFAAVSVVLFPRQVLEVSKPVQFDDVVPVALTRTSGLFPPNRKLLYVEADEKQVKIVFEDGVKLQKGKFSDVTAQISVSGQQVHKSFWVACDAVQAARRNGRNLQLMLKGGIEVPVGRKFEKKVLRDVRILENQYETNRADAA